ncbi:hypothetical protein NBRC116589_13370 [Ruegeria sp. HU-ET01832]|uniref:hypothetical protein n=1 Tax=Ruegeria sp. HU-ET01832 TaxID=3135906 RepID=UPI003106899B
MDEVKYTDENGDPIPVEETPGYLGNIFDGEFMTGEELAPLYDFDWAGYATMADELGALYRRLQFQCESETIDLQADPYSVETFISALPSVAALYDCPPDQGPAGGSGWVFVMVDGWDLEQVKAHVQVLKTVLDADFDALSKQYENE